jgi:membrane-bound lytic murein transglycosylase D
MKNGQPTVVSRFPESTPNKQPPATGPKNPATKTEAKAKTNPVLPQPTAATKGVVDEKAEAEKDIMEEALILLNESHRAWVGGDLEEALEILDQAYALLLDTNGNLDVSRQKDDLRLMISKRILSIYNSIQTQAKGVRSEIPLASNPDVEKEIRQFQTVERDFFISAYQRSAAYRPIIQRELRKAGLPEELVWLPLVESGFKISALSPARALGLWQFIPSTGYKYGLNRDEWIDERMDFEKSTRAAIDYLKELHTMFGDWLTVLAAYNCGEGRVMRTIASQHINYLDRFWDLYQRLPYETARYVPRFLATVLIIKDPQKYGIDLGADRTTALAFETAQIAKSMRLQDIAHKLDIPEETLNILNAELRHKITPDKPYLLRVPPEMAERLQKVIDEIAAADRPREVSRGKRAVVIKHKVRPGETLASIAGKYHTSVSAIQGANKLSKNATKVAAGTRLNVPITGKEVGPERVSKAEATAQHKVQKGETLASIARQYDLDVAALKKVNNLASDQLKIGQTLRIGKPSGDPGRTKPATGHEPEKSKGASAVKPAAGKKDAVAAAAKPYTVKKGDTLNKIARENNMTLEQLRKLNNLTNRDDLIPGQVLQVK